MFPQFIYDLDSLLELLDKFYLKYGVNTRKLENVKYAINELKSLDFHYGNDISNIQNIVKKLEEIIDNLNDILRGLSDNHVNYSYPILKEYLTNREYYLQEDRNKAFQKQLKHNDYDIYLINGLQLVNLFDKKKIISFDTEEELQGYIKNSFYIVIKPKTNNFEEEFKKYYHCLLKRGYNYTTNEYYNPFSIAMELVSIFDGKVIEDGTNSGIPFYCKSFNYPKDFNNEEYLEKLKEFLNMHHDEEFVKNYREMRLLEKKIQMQIGRLYQISKNYSNIISRLKENTNTISLSNEILFLQKCYKAYVPKFGYGDYIHIDYYKAIDAEFLRKLLNDNSIGTWKTDEEVMHWYDRDYNVCIYKQGFSWAQCADVFHHDKKLECELDSLDYSDSETIENLIQDKYIIEANNKLDYKTLLKEYYSNFGMNPKDFVEMIQSKYECKVVCPSRESQSTRIIVKH